MGSKKRLFLTSLAGAFVALSLAAVLTPSLMHSGHRVTAADGAGALAISVDGMTPMAETYEIPVGAEQGFSVLRLADGAPAGLVRIGDAEWSLATDGGAVLDAVPGEFVATVRANAAGDAALFVTTPDGQADVVTLVFTELKAAAAPEAKTLSAVSVVQPAAGAAVYVPTVGATPLAVVAEPDDLADVSSVDFAWPDSTTPAGTDSDGDFPYIGFIPDVNGVTSVAVEAFNAGATASVTANGSWTVATAADTNGDGFPDDPFGLNMAPGDAWVSLPGGLAGVSVVMMGLPSAPADKDLDVASLDLFKVIVPIATGSYEIGVPRDLLGETEKGILAVAVAPDLDTLVGAGLAASIPALPDGADALLSSLLLIDVMVQAEGSTTWTSIDPARLAANPLYIVGYEVAGVTAATNARLFAYGASLVDGGAPNGPQIEIPAGAAWAPTAEGVSLDVETFAAELPGLSIIGLFETTSLINIAGVNNVVIGGPQDYAIGGNEVEITVNNLAGLTAGDVEVTIGGQLATVSDVAGDVITAVVPRAADLAEPAETASADLRVEILATGEFDEIPNGFTYLGPVATAITPADGPSVGGTSIVIDGSGFDANGMGVSLGGSAVLTGAITPVSISGTTSAADPGIVGLELITANNFAGSLADAFTYTPPVPALTSVTPDTALTTAQSTVRVEGSFFDPSADFGTLNGGLTAFFDTDVNNPAAGSEAANVVFWDETNLDVVTPAGPSAGVTGLFVRATVQAKALPYAANSNVLPFTFIDGTQAEMVITGVAPATGPLSGGNTVTITGTSFPPSIGDPIATGNVIRAARVATAGASTVDVPVYLFRAADATKAPAAINFTLLYDSSVLTYTGPGAGGGIANLDNEVLDDEYGKDISVNQNSPGILKFVIAGVNTNEITLDGLDNPFTLFTLPFNVVGAADQFSFLLVQNVTMVDGTASVFPANGDNGIVYVGDAVVLPDPPRVFFGPNEATVVASSETEISVIAPAGVRLGAVDIIVDDSNASKPDNVAVLSAFTAGGYTYVLDGGAFISSITPDDAYVFGGVVARVEGSGFVPGTTQVLFDGVAAELAPPADYASDANNLYVIVPQLEGLGNTPADPLSQTVQVTVANNSKDLKVGNAVPFTYHRFSQGTAITAGASGEVMTNAFFFDPNNESGSGEREIILTRAGDATTAAGAFALPAITAAELGAASDLTSDVFVLVRATKAPKLFGTHEIEAGSPVANVWNFDIHLYEGAYPFAELGDVTFDTDPAQGDVTLATLTYPVDDTALTVGDLNNGDVSTMSLDSTLDYTNFNAPAIYTYDPDSERYQSTVSESEFAAEGTDEASQVTEVTARLAHLSALALRTGVPAPGLAISSIEDSVTGLPTGPLQGGTTIIIRGQGLGWPASVTFDGIPATNVTGVSDQELTCTLPEGLVEDVPVDVVVTLVDARSVTAADAFTYYLDIDFVITPNVGLPAGGNTVTFTGVGLLGVSQVLFGTQAATFTPGTDTQFTAVVPAASGPSVVSVTVTADLGTRTIDRAYTYIPQGGLMVTSIVVQGTDGPLAPGGGTVVISGQGFSNVLQLTLIFNDGTAVTLVEGIDFFVDSDGQIALTLTPERLIELANGAGLTSIPPGPVTLLLDTAAGSVEIEDAFVVASDTAEVLVYSVTPDSAWVIGGFVAEILGQNFGDPSVMTAAFEYNTPSLSPELAKGPVPYETVTVPLEILSGSEYPNNSTKLYVRIPPLPGVNDAWPAVVAMDRLMLWKDGVPVYGMLVKEADSEKCDPIFTYYRWWEDESGVITTAFYYDNALGADAREIVLNSGPLNAALTVPTLSTDFFDADVTGNTDYVYVLARAGLDETAFGETDFAALPGEGIDNAWVFDIHLYADVATSKALLPPASNLLYQEIAPQFVVAPDTDGLNVVPARLTIPTNYTLLTAGDIRDGLIALYGQPSEVGDLVAPDVVGATTAATDGVYQSTILASFDGLPEFFPDAAAAADTQPVEKVRARVYDFSAFTLRQGTDAAPDPTLTSSTNADGGPAEGPIEGGTEVILYGTGLGWVETVEFGTDGKAFTPATIISGGDTNEFALRVLSPEVNSAGVVDIRITTAAGKQAVLEDGFTYTGGGQGILALLLGLGLALIGLFAGGDSGDGGCFIATAAYGTSMEAEIDVLRSVRDTYLLDNAVGTAFVDAYYRVSPYIAVYVAKSPVLAAMVRVALTPVIAVSKLVLAMPHVTAGLGLLAIAGAMLRKLQRKTRKA